MLATEKERKTKQSLTLVHKGKMKQKAPARRSGMGPNESLHMWGWRTNIAGEPFRKSCVDGPLLLKFTKL